MTNTLSELHVIQYRRLYGLPPNSPPGVEESEGQTMDQLAIVDSHIEGFLVIESKELISSFENIVVVQQHSIEETTFCFRMEDHRGT